MYCLSSIQTSQVFPVLSGVEGKTCEVYILLN